MLHAVHILLESRSILKVLRSLAMKTSISFSFSSSFSLTYWNTELKF